MSTTLERILKIEAEIGNLAVKKDELGKLYISEKFRFSKGDKISINFEDKYFTGVDPLNCEIINIFFDSHCFVTGLCIKLLVIPINKMGIKIRNRSGIMIDSNVASISKFYK